MGSRGRLGAHTTTTEGENLHGFQRCHLMLKHVAEHTAFVALRTIVAVAGEDYCIVAADTRMSTGFNIMTRTATKLCELCAGPLDDQGEELAKLTQRWSCSRERAPAVLPTWTVGSRELRQLTLDCIVLRHWRPRWPRSLLGFFRLQVRQVRHRICGFHG